MNTDHQAAARESPTSTNLCLNGDVNFENHANTLTDESKIVADMSPLNLTQS
ncbi:hypothetical protein EYZ11_012727 [Aspergillus tanneri]|uniref:Uncharacterized protein n=1 Tax=Aspergillus tanneri TaxID=1220188 RepID=A0A4S3IZH0_9EURO|nr:hypothetical protein EYZ11_012727 [Aspergillus tanneri]